MKLPILYHKGKSGAIYSWKIWTEGETIWSEHGQIDGEKQIAERLATAKNVGKANETTDEQQAELEAKSMHTFKLERKYSLSKEEADEPMLLPMLAHDYYKHIKKEVMSYF